MAMRGNSTTRLQNGWLTAVQSPVNTAFLAVFLVMLTLGIYASPVQAMDIELKLDIEEAWLAHPDKAVYQRLKGAGKQEEAQALKRQVLIHLTRTAVRDFMRDQERRLDDYVMRKIDETIAHTRGFNLPEPTRELFREQYKHELYQFLINYSFNSELHEMYTTMGRRISSGDQFYEQIHQYTTRNAQAIMINLEQIALKTMDEIFSDEERELYSQVVGRFTRVLLTRIGGD